MKANAAILAGGLGKRFRPYTEILPKPMVPLGSSEKPLLEYIIAWMRVNGYRNIALLLGYKWRYVYNYFGDGSRMGVRIVYSVDDDDYRGTGGAILGAVKKGLVGGESFLVWYGDILAEAPLITLQEFHEERGLDATLMVSDRYQVPVGVVELESGYRVSRVQEKPWMPLKAFIGIAVFKTRSFREASEKLGLSEFDIMGDLIPLMIDEGYEVGAYIYRGPWYDVGSLERYEKIDQEFVESMEKKLGFA